jgi:hypothetical protein
VTPLLHHVNEINAIYRTTFSDYVPVRVYPPGRILYLSQEVKKENRNATAGRRRRRDGHHSKKRSTIVRQVPPEFFQDLIISPSMFHLTKHVPALYESSLRAAALHARS